MRDANLYGYKNYLRKFTRCMFDIICLQMYFMGKIMSVCQCITMICEVDPTGMMFQNYNMS